MLVSGQEIMERYKFLLLILLIAPSARFIFKYIPVLQTTSLLIYALLILFFCYFFQRLPANVRNLIGNYWYIFFVFLVITLLLLFFYPIADGLKLQNRGSDQDDCVIIGARGILDFQNPYSQRSYFGNPCSSGMGVLFLYVPFVFLNVYHLGAIAFTALSTYIVKWYSDSVYCSACFVTLLFGGLFQLEMLFIGTDLYLIGCLLMVSSLVLTRAVLTKSMILVFYAALLVGLLASSRINFLILVPITSLFIYFHWRNAALLFCLISLCIATVPSIYVFSLSPVDFTPFHLLVKANVLLGNGLKELFLATFAVTFFFGVHLARKSKSYIPISIFISTAPTLLAPAVGDLLIVRNGQLSQWEGASYLLPLFPLGIALYVITANKKMSGELL